MGVRPVALKLPRALYTTPAETQMTREQGHRSSAEPGFGVQKPDHNPVVARVSSDSCSTQLLNAQMVKCHQLLPRPRYSHACTCACRFRLIWPTTLLGRARAQLLPPSCRQQNRPLLGPPHTLSLLISRTRRKRPPSPHQAAEVVRQCLLQKAG